MGKVEGGDNDKLEADDETDNRSLDNTDLAEIEALFGDMVCVCGAAAAAAAAAAMAAAAEDVAPEAVPMGD